MRSLLLGESSIATEKGWRFQKHVRRKIQTPYEIGCENTEEKKEVIEDGRAALDHRFGDYGVDYMEGDQETKKKRSIEKLFVSFFTFSHRSRTIRN